MALSTRRLLLKFLQRCNLVRYQPSASSSRHNCGKPEHDSQRVRKDYKTGVTAKLPAGPPLEHFIANSGNSAVETEPVTRMIDEETIPFINKQDLNANGRKVYFDVYGCQMNTNDTEVAWSVLQKYGYVRTLDMADANVVLVMTCAIRDSAEQKIWNKIQHLTILKRKKGFKKFKIGILGCMAERLKTKIIEQEKLVDLVCGPDAYRDLPRLLANTYSGQTADKPLLSNCECLDCKADALPLDHAFHILLVVAVNVLLSLDETYADVMPVRLNEDSKSAYVSIMRGCDNMCSYCIVPFTRGRERSRPIDSILEEVRQLSNQGVKEVTLLGQNVNSYRDTTESKFYGTPDLDNPTQLRDGFKTVYKTKYGGRRFSELLDKVSLIDPEMRVRFTAAHPKDFPDEVLYLIRERSNICNQLHLPCQSGSTSVLQAMRRGYTRDSYLELVEHVRSILPDVALTSDIISGFCGETDQDHRDTIDLMKTVKYSMVYSFPYSMRQKTHAYHRLEDNVPHDVKARRSAEVKDTYLKVAEQLHKSQIGQYQLVLVEKENSKSQILGKNDEGIIVAMPNTELPCDGSLRKPEPGDYVIAQVYGASAKTFLGRPIQYSSIVDFTHNFCAINTYRTSEQASR